MCKMSESDFQEFDVLVDNPQKHFDPLETYVTFRVTTKVNGSSSNREEHMVRRRYSDFLWLRNKLIESFPTFVVPALPAKHSVLEQLDRYSRTFILTRMVMLHSFLKRLTSHPVFSCSPVLKLFLTAKSTEFTMHSKASSGILDRLTGSFQTLTSIAAKGSCVNPEFKAIKVYVDNLSQKLSAILAVNCKVFKERVELQVELEDAKRALTQWSYVETDLNREIFAVTTAVESIARSQHNHIINDFNSKITQPMEEFINYVDAVREALARRDAIQYCYEISVDESNRKRIEKEQLESMDANSVGFGFKLWKASNRDRIRRLQQELPGCDRFVEENHDKVEIANESIRSDLDRWSVEKVGEIKTILETMADHHVSFYKDTLTAWETALENLKKNREENVLPH